MGSTDSDCCGSYEGPIKPETDSKYLKQMRTNQFSSNTDETPSVTSSASPSPHTDTSESSYKSQSNKNKKRKRKYNRLSTQIRILCSENARAQSLLLCAKPEVIKRNSTIKEFGFLKYLERNLTQHSIGQLFEKFSSKKIDENENANILSISKFLNLFTLVVILYRVKLHQLKTGTTDQPKCDSEKIKTSIEHVAIWCVRTYGQKQNVKKRAKVYDDTGNEVRGEYDIYKFRLSLSEFSSNIYEWVSAYCEADGYYDLDNSSLP